VRQQRRQTSTATLIALMTLLAVALTACSTQQRAKDPADAASVPPGTSAGNSGGPAAPSPSGIGADCRAAGAKRVSSASDLQAALAAAAPGDTILMAPGIYQGNFVASAPGRQGSPITLCGSREAVISAPDINHGYALHLDGASWWRLEGFTVEGGQKGIVADGVSHDLLSDLYVHSTGEEGIHLRAFSSYNTVSHCTVRQTGLIKTFFGEGIYVGSAHKNWCRYTHCQPDRSNYNKIIDNNITDTTAENIDIKEGTTGGLIEGNQLDGAGMVASASTAWINVKGNGWTIKDNTGTNSIGDGFQVHQVYPGWGLDNVFLANNAKVNGPGYGIYVQSHDLGTVVACSNVAEGAASGLTNYPCSGS
jgi:hypothetical protein